MIQELRRETEGNPEIVRFQRLSRRELFGEPSRAMVDAMVDAGVADESPEPLGDLEQPDASMSAEPELEFVGPVVFEEGASDPAGAIVDGGLDGTMVEMPEVAPAHANVAGGLDAEVAPALADVDGGLDGTMVEMPEVAPAVADVDGGLDGTMVDEPELMIVAPSSSGSAPAATLGAATGEKLAFVEESGPAAAGLVLYGLLCL